MTLPPLFLVPQDEIRLFPDSALRLPAREVTEFDQPGKPDGPLTKLAKVLGIQLETYGGVGISAPQIGFASRMIVVADNEEAKKGNYVSCFAFVNPRVAHASKEVWTAAEGCLSLPGLKVAIERPVSVRVEAQDVYGEPMPPIEVDEWEARLFQHEIDHLDGKLTIDYLNRVERRQAMVTYMYSMMQRGLWEQTA